MNKERKWSDCDGLTRRDREKIIAGYSRMMMEKQVDGMELYFINFMFNQLPGKTDTRIREMIGEVERVYNTLLTQVVRKPTVESKQHLRPILVAAPDFPVWKHAKERISDLAVNDGLHFNGVIAVPPTRVMHPLHARALGRLEQSRLDVWLDVHFRRNQRIYRSRALDRIHVTPVRRGTMIEYALKAVRTGRAAYDTIVILK